VDIVVEKFSCQLMAKIYPIGPDLHRKSASPRRKPTNKAGVAPTEASHCGPTAL